MPKTAKLLLLAVVALVAFSFVRDLALKVVIAQVASKTIGAPVRIGSLSVGLVRQTVRIKNLRIVNPPGFPKEVFVDIPEVSVNWDPFALLQGRLHLQSAGFQLKEFVLVRNKEGKMNVDSLKVAKKEAAQKPEEKAAQLQIDRLHLQIGRIVEKDFSVSPPRVQVRDINIKKDFKDIKSPQQLVVLVLTEPMKSAGVRGAAIYGAAALTGVGIVPVVAGAVLMGNDKAVAEYGVGFDKVFETALAVVKQMGTLKSADPKQGTISADLPGASVSIKVEKAGLFKSKITVSARKLMMPKPQIAAGVLYEVSDRLK